MRAWRLTPLGWAVAIATLGVALLFRPRSRTFPLNKVGCYERSKNFKR